MNEDALAQATMRLATALIDKASVIEYDQDQNDFHMLFDSVNKAEKTAVFYLADLLDFARALVREEFGNALQEKP